MKKLAILLSLAVLLSSVAAVGFTSLAEEATGTVVFESDFSTLPAEVVPFNSGNNYFENVGAVDGVLDCNTRVTKGSSAWHNDCRMVGESDRSDNCIRHPTGRRHRSKGRKISGKHAD